MSPGAVVLVVIALLAGGSAANGSVPPPDQRDPTPLQVEQSIRVWEPGPAFVRVWDPEGSVSTLEREASDGDETVITLDSDILFDLGSAVIPDVAAARVSELVQQAPQAAAVAVTGHTDSVGDDASNLVLSQERAEAVAAVVRAARPDLVLTVQGLGESQPVAPNEQGGEDDPEGRAANRRVEIRFAG